MGQLFDSAHSRELTLSLMEESLAKQSDDVDELCRFVRKAARGVCPFRPQGLALAQALQDHAGPERAADAC